MEPTPLAPGKEETAPAQLQVASSPALELEACSRAPQLEVKTLEQELRRSAVHSPELQLEESKLQLVGLQQER